jgi:predicted nuclease with TOPRIM domain
MKSQKEHIEAYGHCCSPQDIVNIQSKELRNLKCFIHDLTNKNKALVQENAKLEELNKIFQHEIAQYKEKDDEEEDEENFTDCNLFNLI